MGEITPVYARYYFYLTNILESIAPILPPLALRLLPAWEFGESGYEKFTGTNWFNVLAIGVWWRRKTQP